MASSRSIVAWWVLIAVCGALSATAQAQSGSGEEASLQVEFIGNMAFRLTDGEVTLLSDFPYRSGAFGYNEYDVSLVREYGRALALITHLHPDHWNPELFGETDWALIAPPGLMKATASGRELTFSPSMRFGPIEVIPFETEHRFAAEHLSYLVIWSQGDRSLRLYFTGDTESSDALLAAEDLDVAFVSPWLLRAVAERGASIDADHVVVYHHRTAEVVPEVAGRRVPAQGEIFAFPFVER